MTELSGTTVNGVPFTARAASRPDAPLVAVWHLLDPPCTPAAMAAALPLEGLDAHAVYLGLPLSGARAVHADFGAFLASGMDMVTEFFGPMHEAALTEFPDVRGRLGVAADVPFGVMGGSAGASVAAEVLAVHGARAAVLVNPMLRLRPMIDATAEFLPAPYAWTPLADAFAARMDFVARADELASTRADILVIEGAADERAFLDAVREFEGLGIATVEYVDGVEHPLAAPPGTEPAPQIPAAKLYDARAAAWLREALAR